jgi:hypothetical protein
MSDVALRPLNTSPIRATVGGQVYEAIDADETARRAFEQIDAMTSELKPAIAANFVEGLAAWTGEPGTDDEFDQAKSALVAAGSQSLAALYERAMPMRALPAPPVVEVAASAAPLPDFPTIDDARKWILSWRVQPFAELDLVVTEVSTRPAENATVEATPYELALLALDLEALATTPVAAAVAPLPAVPNGPASGSAILNAGERAGVRAYVIRNDGYPAGFVYVAEGQSEILSPKVDRLEEIFVTSLDEITPLAPSRVEVWYESGQPLTTRMPVLLVIDSFDAAMVADAIEQWRAQTEPPPDGELIFDVTAAGLRLRRVVVD